MAKLPKSAAPVYNDNARDLELFLLNYNPFWGRIIQGAIIPLFEKKVKKGIYDRQQALAKMYELTNDGAKMYCCENCSPGTDYRKMFSINERAGAADSLLMYIEVDYLQIRE